MQTTEGIDLQSMPRDGGVIWRARQTRARMPARTGVPCGGRCQTPDRPAGQWLLSALGIRNIGVRVVGE